jgi:hypothetical protein
MESNESAFVLGQRYTLATVALAIALLSFLNLAGMEKGILAIVLGLRALRPTPQPALERRRVWARAAIALSAAHIALVATIVLLNLDRIAALVDALRGMAELR